MSKAEPNVVAPAAYRVVSDTPSRWRWLVLASLLAHLILTPIAGWVGFIGWLWQEKELPPPEETLETIPIELFNPPEPEAADGTQPALPAEDPVGLIEEVVPDPLALPLQPKALKPEAEPQASATTAVPSAAPSASAAPTAEPAASSPPAAEPSNSASASASAAPSTSAAPSSEAPSSSAPPRNIEGPIEAVGKASSVVKDQAYVSITLHADRIRDHAVGKRIAVLLPSLPQWNDFFPDASLNPVRDFDHVVVVGPSFSNSANVIALLQYNTEPQKVRAAIDKLVERGGAWLPGTKVPAALAHADRAERVFVMASPGLVVVVPPDKKDEILRAKALSIPKAKGPEAMVATLVNPWKPLARYNIEIPKSVKEAKIRLTPLPAGEVKVELQAQDESPEQAAATATKVSQTINALADLSAGVSGLLEFAGFGRTMVALPRVELVARGSEIWGELTLTKEQVDFLLTQLENQALLWNQGAARPRARPASSAKKPTQQLPAHPRGGVKFAPAGE